MAIFDIFKNSTKIKRFKNKLKSNIFFIYDSFFYFLVILRGSKKDQKLVIVSASDNEFYESLLQLIKSVNTYESDSKFIIYDIGLEEDQKNNLINDNSIEIRDFKFENYPKFVRERDEFGKLGAYAWKSIIMYEVLKNEKEDIVIWLDAGNKLTGSLKRLKRVVSFNKFYSPLSSGDLKEWCHIKTLDYFKVPKSLYKKPNLTGGIVAFDGSNDEARELAEQWFFYSNIKECISPDGSNRNNHRQDQSLLSILFYLDKALKFSPKTKKFFSILVNQNPGKRIYLLDATEKNKFKSEWLKKYNSISTNTISYSEGIWILNIREIMKVEKKHLKEKKVVINIFSDSDLEVLIKNNKVIKTHSPDLYFIYNNDLYKEKILDEGFKPKKFYKEEQTIDHQKFESSILSILED